jgi:hypothetical protein
MKEAHTIKRRYGRGLEINRDLCVFLKVSKNIINNFMLVSMET